MKNLIKSYFASLSGAIFFLVTTPNPTTQGWWFCIGGLFGSSLMMIGALAFDWIESKHNER